MTSNYVLKNLKRYRIIIILVGAAFLLAVIVLLAYELSWAWTGFTAGQSNEFTISRTGNNFTVSQLQPTKSLWDWLTPLAALAIPVVVGLGAAWYGTNQTQATDRATNKQRETELQLATDQQREDRFQNYLDHITDLFLKYNLRGGSPDDELRNVARMRTLTTLIRLDPQRINFMLSFLRESGLAATSADNNPIVTFKGAKLSELDLSGVDLNGFDFSNANLKDAKLCGAMLFGANLNGAILYGADLSDAAASTTISDPSMPNKTTTLGANWTKVVLMNANLAHANFRGSSLCDVGLFHAHLPEADFTEGTFDKVYFNGADLTGAYLSRTRFTRDCEFSGATLRDANLFKAQLIEVTLHAVDFTNAKMDEAILTGANLTIATLDKCTMKQAQLTRATLIGAHMTRTDLTKANLHGANLSKAGAFPDDINPAQLDSVFHTGTSFPGSGYKGAVLREASLRSTDLTNATLVGADLTGADLTEADLSEADLRGAIVSVQQLRKARKLNGAILPDCSRHPA